MQYTKRLRHDYTLPILGHYRVILDDKTFDVMRALVGDRFRACVLPIILGYFAAQLSLGESFPFVSVASLIRFGYIDAILRGSPCNGSVSRIVQIATGRSLSNESLPSPVVLHVISCCDRR